jgi:hypothetical protein
MAKATGLPEGVKKAQVVLNTYDEDTDITKVVTRDGKHYYSKAGDDWSEEDPNNGDGPKYDAAQEEYDDPEQEGEGQRNENVAEGRAEDEDDDDATGAKPAPPKTQAQLKAEAAENKAANLRTQAAQKLAAAEGSPEATTQNALLNRQARLAGEKVTDQHPVDSGPGGSGGIRTLSQREIEILEGSEKAKAARQEARPGIDQGLPETPEGEEPPLGGKPPEPPLGGSLSDEQGRAYARIMDDTRAREEMDALKKEVADLKLEVRRKNAMIDKQQVALRGKFEGRSADDDDDDDDGPGKNSPAHLAPQPMAGVYPHNTDQIPTVDEINARNGQPERSPRPEVRGSKQRDEQGYPIVPPPQPTD